MAIILQVSEPKHLPGVVRLSDIGFGKGYMTLDLACQYSEFLIALKNDKVIGYALNIIEERYTH